jgi:transposase-like protein
MKEAAETLVEDVGLGLRDAGELLEISHQRVQQLVREAP